MDDSTRRLHERLHRHARGAVAAWEDWLGEHPALAPASALFQHTVLRLIKGCLTAYDSWRRSAS